MNEKLIFASAAAIALGLTLAVAAWWIDSSVQVRAVNFVLLALAAACGWLVGTLVSPYDSKEERAFTTYSKAVSAFATGYLLAKTDRIAELIFSPEFLARPFAAFRMLLFLAAFTVAMLFTFIMRRYA